jgi:hypothetical protein
MEVSAGNLQFLSSNIIILTPLQLSFIDVKRANIKQTYRHPLDVKV